MANERPLVRAELAAVLAVRHHALGCRRTVSAATEGFSSMAAEVGDHRDVGFAGSSEELAMECGFVRNESVGGVVGPARLHAVRSLPAGRPFGRPAYLTACTSTGAVLLPAPDFDPLLDTACPECRALAIINA